MQMRGNRFIPLQDPIPCRTMKLLDKKGRMNMELTYSPQGDYLLPNLTLSEAETTIGKYGMMRKTFLKTERKGMYAHLMLSGQSTGQRGSRSTGRCRSCSRLTRRRTRRAIRWPGRDT